MVSWSCCSISPSLLKLDVRLYAYAKGVRPLRKLGELCALSSFSYAVDLCVNPSPISSPRRTDPPFAVFEKDTVTILLAAFNQDSCLLGLGRRTVDGPLIDAVQGFGVFLQNTCLKHIEEEVRSCNSRSRILPVCVVF